MLVGVEGDVAWGARTKYEWLALIEDIDRGVKAGIIKLRPKSKRFSFPGDFEEEVSDWASKKGKRRIALICSCPSRLGDDTTTMVQVEEAASEFDNIECCWSRAGNLADKIFEAGSVPGAGHEDLVPAQHLADAGAAIAALRAELAAAAAEPVPEGDLSGAAAAATAVAEADALRAEVHAVKAQLEKAEAAAEKVGELQEKNDDLKMTVLSRVREVHALKSDLSGAAAAAVAEADVLRAEVQAARAEVQAVKAQLEKVEAASVASTAALAEQQRALAATMADLDRQRAAAARPRSRRGSRAALRRWPAGTRSGRCSRARPRPAAVSRSAGCRRTSPPTT
jgi:hypothetical protein